MQPKPEATSDPVDETALKKEAPYMRNLFDLITPHEDIRKGNFDEAVFAADVGDVADGSAPNDYNDPYLFFKKTYLTNGLHNMLKRVYNKLSTGQGSSVVQVQTPFGGGKTHSLVTLYHYLKNGSKVKELLPADIDLLSPHISVIAGNHWNPLQGRRSEGITRLTFWGEIAYQIGGKAGYEEFRANDEQRISPGKEKLRNFLEAHQPFILLFDEILEYINRAYDVRDQLQGSLGTQTYSFFQELTEAVASLEKGILVVTLPSSNLEDFGDREEESLARLGKIFGRLESIETPVQGEEVYAVIRRRLFEVETLKIREMRETIHHYFQLYQHHRDDLPAKARDLNYKEKMEKAYPFHPDLIDILIEKWSTFSSFQRTRGVLRLLANIVEDLYQSERTIDLILPGDINLDKPSIRQEFLKHIGSEYEGVIASDIAGHEAKSEAMDKANRSWKHLAQRISNAIFFHSFSADDAEKGINLPYIKLAVLRSDTMPALATEVLQKLNNQLWYINTRGDNYYFSRIPNLNRMILDKKELYNVTYEGELRRIIEKEVGPKFKSYLWPDSSDAIPDNRSLKLIILRPEDNGNQIPDWIARKGNNFREYQNTLFFALADTAAFARLREDVKTVMALQDIEESIKSGEMAQLETKREEIRRRLRNIERDYSYNVRRMYHTVQFGGRKQDLGQPVTGAETLSGWFWRELSDPNLGAIVTQLSYRTIVNKFMGDNEQVSASVILNQFYKNTDLPALSEEGIVARAIQLGVQDKALGLGEMRESNIDPLSIKFGEPIPFDSVSFEPDLYVIDRSIAESLKAQIAPELELDPTTEMASTGSATPAIDSASVSVAPETTKPTPTSETSYKRVRLVIEGIPASKIADVNRGIFMPIKSSVGEFTFSLEIDVSSAEGISQATLENKIKETIRQIGASLREEGLT